MTNNASAFDTLQAARDLKAAGIESDQAEAIASKMGEAPIRVGRTWSRKRT